MNPPKRLGHGGTGVPTPPPTGGGISRRASNQPRGVTPPGYRGPETKPQPIHGRTSKLAKAKDVCSPVHIANAIEAAKRGVSGLPAGVLPIRGFSTPAIRRLIYNLLASEKPIRYLEVGAYCGGTCCAAISQDNVDAYIFEDGSQPFGAENVIQQLYDNLNLTKLGHGSTYRLFERDFFKFMEEVPSIATFKQIPPAPFDVFFYDGEHTAEKQEAALLAIAKDLADYSIFIVDDFDWPQVREGTESALEVVSEQFEVIGRWELSDGKPDGPLWHNGFAVFLLHRI